MINKDFYGLQYLQGKKLKGLKELGFVEKFNELDFSNLSEDKKEVIKNFGHHIWTTKGCKDMLSKEHYCDIDSLINDNDEFLNQVNLYGRNCNPYFKPFCIFKIVKNNGNEEILAEDNTTENKVVLNLDLPNTKLNYNTITIADDLTAQPNHEIRTLDNFDNPLSIRSNENGEFWVIYGHTIDEVSSYSILFDTIIIYYEELEN